MKTCLLAAAVFLTASPLHSAPVIAIQPLGAVKAERLEAVRKGLEKSFGLKVEVLAEKPLPPEAWYAPRGRYRAGKLLDKLRDKADDSHQLVIGITSKDISTTKGEHEDWGIFGLGEVGGRACVVSTFRLNARGADEMKLRDRLRKVAVHEAGHVMGLDHCPQAGCVMADAEGSISTVDGETGEFCKECASKRMAWIDGWK